MPRHARLVLPGLPHHVVQRGHDRRTVFRRTEDFRRYLHWLAELSVAFEIRVYAWCLMPNHVHLVFDPGATPATLSQLMKRLAGRYTRRLNHLHRRTGTAWEGRFHCSPIDCDRYLLTCVRYVELNPVRAGLAPNAGDYPHSSFRERIGIVPTRLLTLDPAYLDLGTTDQRRRDAYLAACRGPFDDADLERLRDGVRSNRLTTSETNLGPIAGTSREGLLPRPPGRPPRRQAPEKGTDPVFAEK
jgi:putative transposase